MISDPPRLATLEAVVDQHEVRVVRVERGALPGRALALVGDRRAATMVEHVATCAKRPRTRRVKRREMIGETVGETVGEAVGETIGEAVGETVKRERADPVEL